MPERNESGKWRVVVFPVYSTKVANRLLGKLGPEAQAWWAPGTYYTAPAVAKAVAVWLRPARLGTETEADDLVERAAGILEEGHDLLLDWCGGLSPEGRVLLVVKTRAACQRTGRGKVFRLTRRDLAALRALVPGAKGRERPRERGR